MKNKKGLIILSTVVVICAVGFIVSPLVDWSVDSGSTSGDISKSSRFSRKTATESLTNMEELMLNDESYKNGVVVSYVVMQTRAQQFANLVDASNEVAGQIAEFASTLKDMDKARQTAKNVCASLAQAGDDINATLEGESRPDLAQNTMNASLAYMTLQKQNELADRFIETADNYLKKAEGNDRLKFVRDQWVDYQRLTAALDGDEKSAKELEDKGYLLTCEQGAAALKEFDGHIQFGLAQVFVLCESINVSTELGDAYKDITMNDLFMMQNDALSITMQEVAQAESPLNEQQITDLLGENLIISLGEQAGITLGEQAGITLGEQAGITLGEQAGITLGEMATQVMSMINPSVVSSFNNLTLQHGAGEIQSNDVFNEIFTIGESIKTITMGEVPHLNFY